MELFKDKDKRRGAIGTILFHLALLAIFALYGLKYIEPRPEQGVIINFGTSNVGSGETQPDDSGEPVEEVSETQEEAVPEESTPTDAVQEEVMTQETEEAIETPAEKAKRLQEEQERREEEERVKKEQEFQNKMKNIWNKTKEGGSEGDDKEKGDKGQEDGEKSPGAYSGTPGGGGGGNGDYFMGGRSRLKEVIPEPDCQEFGIVYINVWVNPQGVTIDATLRHQKTTNIADCIVRKAIEAAKKQKWEPNAKAPDRQVGWIKYEFLAK